MARIASWPSMVPSRLGCPVALLLSIFFSSSERRCRGAAVLLTLFVHQWTTLPCGPTCFTNSGTNCVADAPLPRTTTFLSLNWTD